jgi:hypothetical protein
MAGQSWGSLSFLYGPVLAFFGIGILVLFLRWGWTRGKSVVGASSRPGDPENYGQLEVVASCANLVEAEVLKLALKESGIQSTVANTTAGPKVYVWPKDKEIAKNILQKRKPI